MDVRALQCVRSLVPLTLPTCDLEAPLVTVGTDVLRSEILHGSQDINSPAKPSLLSCLSGS